MRYAEVMVQVKLTNVHHKAVVLGRIQSSVASISTGIFTDNNNYNAYSIMVPH